jgi:hypothetical protein
MPVLGDTSSPDPSGMWQPRSSSLFRAFPASFHFTGWIRPIPLVALKRRQLTGYGSGEYSVQFLVDFAMFIRIVLL